MSAPITFGSQLLAAELPEYLRENPEISLELCLSNRTVDLVEERFDVLFRTGELPDSQLIARRLSPYKMVICAAPSYIKHAATLDVPGDLSRHECLILTHTAMRTEWKFTGPDGLQSVQVTGRFKTDNSEALRVAALAGLGIIMQPLPLLCADISAGSLVRLRAGRPVHVLYAQDRRMMPKLRSFLEFCVDRFGS